MRPSVLLLVLAGATVVGAAPVQAQRAPAPAALASRDAPVADATLADWLPGEIARRWAVAADRIELDWGDTPARIRARAAEGAELAGGTTGAWTVSVPAHADDGPRRVLVQAGLRTRVPTAARELSRGAELTTDDVVWREQVIWGPPGAPLTDPVGLRSQRRISTGETLEEPSVAPGPWVESRDPVEVVYERGPVTIALRGTALADARPGERVHVRLEDGRRVQGRTVGPGRVALDAGGDR